MLIALEEFFLTISSNSLVWYIKSSALFKFQLFICCLTISLSFQNIGGLKDEITCSRFLLLLTSQRSLYNLLDLFKRVLIINIQSSDEKLFSFKICTVFLKFFARQLSISSDTL